MNQVRIHIHAKEFILTETFNIISYYKEHHEVSFVSILINSIKNVFSRPNWANSTMRLSKIERSEKLSL